MYPLGNAHDAENTPAEDGVFPVTILKQNPFKLLFKEILECYLRFLENIEIGGDFYERNNKKYT